MLINCRKCDAPLTTTVEAQVGLCSICLYTLIEELEGQVLDEDTDLLQDERGEQPFSDRP